MPMGKERIALFIDGPNLFATAKSIGCEVDYRRLLQEFQSRGQVVRAFYYTAIIDDQEFSSIRPLIDWLDYNGYTVVTKATKEFIDANGRRKVKGNMDIELAIDAMELAEHIDEMVRFSGDGEPPGAAVFLGCLELFELAKDGNGTLRQRHTIFRDPPSFAATG